MENLTGTIFRKVSVKEKLPTGEGFMRLLVWDKKGIDIWDDYDPNEFDDEATLKQHYTHWLEEIELPTNEKIIKRSGYPIPNGWTHSARFEEGAKWVRDFVLAATPNELQK